MTTTMRGLSAFPVTPSHEDGRIDTESLQKLVERLVSAGVDSIGLLGSTGSYPYFSRAERRRAAAARDRVCCWACANSGGGGRLAHGRGNRPGDGRQGCRGGGWFTGPDVLHTAARRRSVSAFPGCCSDKGCQYASTTTRGRPTSPSRPGLWAGCRPCLAWLRSRTRHPLRRKVPRPSLACAALYPTVFSVGFSVDWHAGAALLAGADAWYSVLGGIYPATCLRLTRACQAGDAVAAARIDAQLQPVWALFKTYTSFRVVHLAATLAGIANARPIRPILPLSGAAEKEVTRQLEELAFD